MKYIGKMDPECIPLCDAMNALPGIKTFESCCGHGKHAFIVFFKAPSFNAIKPIIAAAEIWYWTVRVKCSSVTDEMYFILESPEPDSNWKFDTILSTVEDITKILGEKR
jgi:hypothetical protein